MLLQATDPVLQQLITQQETLINWAIAIGGILCTVIGALWIKWQADIKERDKEIIRLNTEILNLQKEHSRELREMHIKSASVIEKVGDLMKQYEYNKRGTT